MRRWKATGGWCWLVDELEAAGLIPHLTQPFAAKRMMGMGGKKTDRVDARCLATLLRNRTLPETWIPDSANGGVERTSDGSTARKASHGSGARPATLHDVSPVALIALH